MTNELDLVSMIGIILLIGIVKDRHHDGRFCLDAERNEGLRPEESIYQRALSGSGPIMMTTMAADVWLVAAGDRNGRGASRASLLGDRRGLSFRSRCSRSIPRR